MTDEINENRYDFRAIEKKWQARWEEDNLFRVENHSDRPKFYGLDFFPYPSGAGISVGHCRNYVPLDVACRHKTMQGYSVLHPMGWDAFGQPAENEAIKQGRNPKEMVPEYAANYKRQLQLVGVSYDWSREINSSSPDYYKWTQWLFLLLYQRGLAYRANTPINWCPVDKTGLANEEVVNGRCWRCGTLVEKRPMPQWYFKITEYADRPDFRTRYDSVARRHQNAAKRMDRKERRRGSRIQGVGRRGSGVGKQGGVGVSSRGGKHFFRHPTPDTRHPPCLYDAARHALGRDLYGSGAGASARGADYDGGTKSGSGRLRCESAARNGNRTAGDGQDENGRVYRRVCRESREWREYPGLDRRLCFNGLWHGRDYGGSRATISATSSSPANLIFPSCWFIKPTNRRQRKP